MLALSLPSNHDAVTHLPIRCSQGKDFKALDHLIYHNMYILYKLLYIIVNVYIYINSITCIHIFIHTNIYQIYNIIMLY